MKRIRTAWMQVINAGSDRLQIYEHRQGICRGVNFLSSIIVLLNLTVGPAFGVATHQLSVLLGALTEAVVVSGIILLNYYGKYLIANISLFVLLNIATLYFGSILSPSVGAQIMIVLLVVLSLFLFDKTTARAVAIGCSIIAMSLMELNLRYKFVDHIETASNVTDYMRWAADLTVGSLVVILFNLYDRNNNRLLIKLREYSKKKDLSLKHEKTASEQKSRYIRNAYHEVRSQFRFVSMIVRLLHDSNQKGELVPEMLDNILKDLISGDQILEMTLLNILEYSKYQAGVTDKVYYEPLNLRVIVGELVNLFKYLSRNKEVNISLEIEDGIEYFSSDRTKLTGILTNLIHNSYKFSNPKSTISIDIRTMKDKLRFTVSDQSKGIPAEKLPHIFDPWFSERTINNGEGIGLGLGIVKQLVMQLDGEIKVKTKKEIGTTFFVFLPIKDTNTPERHIVKEHKVRY